MKIRNVLIGLEALLTALSFFIFSRFTVDDAFIAWRYGKNLVEHAVWNYNPSNLDLTQAYTSPLYAILSIVPNLLAVDVVFFFKIIATATVVIFVIWMRKKVRSSWLLIFAFIAIPPTMVHIYAGMETFLYVFLMSALLIAVQEKKVILSVCLANILFITRPESWLLVVLLPIILSIDELSVKIENGRASFATFRNTLHLRSKRISLIFLSLSGPLLVYLYVHYMHFGNPFPNTFYAKSGSTFNFRTFLSLMIICAPCIALWKYRQFRILGLIAPLFGAWVFSYSTSQLMMDYAGRFIYHVFVPIFVLHIYLSSSVQGNMYLKLRSTVGKVIEFRKKTVAEIGMFAYVILFIALSTQDVGLLTAYYPRALAAHAQLGKTLRQIASKYELDAFSFGDAGMAAYHSGLNALDNVGLASSEVVRNGVSASLLEKYSLDIVAFHATAEGIRLTEHNQEPIFRWVSQNGFILTSIIYWTENYTIHIYAKSYIAELADLGKESEHLNKASNRKLLKQILMHPPWYYWRE